ncbi:MAG: hypothetical protein ACRC62_01445 [Microcoleus sp.]
MRESVTLLEFSTLCGRTPAERTLREWKLSAHDFPKDRGGGKYDLSELIQFTLAKYKFGGGEIKEAEIIAKTDLSRAQVERIHWQRSIVEKEYVLKTEVIGVWVGYIQACRAKLLALPSGIADGLAGVDDPILVREMLKREIDEALEELCDDAAEFASNFDNPDGAVLETTA